MSLLRPVLFQGLGPAEGILGLTEAVEEGFLIGQGCQRQRDEMVGKSMGSGAKA